MIRSLVLYGIVMAYAGVVCAENLSGDRLLYRRSGVTPLVIDRLELLPDGVRVFTKVDGLTREQIVPWAMISSVDPMANNLMEEGLVEGLRIGEDLWRGRSRLLRGDSRLALPPLQEAWEKLAGQGSATEAFAAEGFLRSALIQGRPELGIVPGLRCLELADQGISTDRFADLGVVFDQELGVIPTLPPIVNDEACIHVVKQLDEMIARASNPSPRMVLFRSLLLREVPSDVNKEKGEKPGIEFLRLLSELNSPESARRERARIRLLASLDSATGWRESWVHFFVGRSLVENETDPDLNMVGVLELLHLPPLEGVAPRELIRRALSLSSQTLRKLGNTEYADRIDLHAESSGFAGIEEKRP